MMEPSWIHSSLLYFHWLGIFTDLPAGNLPPQWHTPLYSLHHLTLPQRSSFIPVKTKVQVVMKGKNIANIIEQTDFEFWFGHSFLVWSLCECMCAGDAVMWKPHGCPLSSWLNPSNFVLFDFNEENHVKVESHITCQLYAYTITFARQWGFYLNTKIWHFDNITHCDWTSVDTLWWVETRRKPIHKFQFRNIICK